MPKPKRDKTHAFVDASNLFYGGEKSLGWKIDYLKLTKYLRSKYKVGEVYYFGGVGAHGYQYNYLKNETVPLQKLEKFLSASIKDRQNKFNKANLSLLSRDLRRIHFYLKLQKFGYKLFL